MAGTAMKRFGEADESVGALLLVSPHGGAVHHAFAH